MDSRFAFPFPTTQWSMVLGARDARDRAAAANALAHLCRQYWYPLYAFARRRGRNAHDARDVTQGFFAHLLAKDLLASADPLQGKLRTFLLTAFARFLKDETEREQAGKRGGGCEVLSLDTEEGERRFLREALDGMTPEKIFDKSWALTLARAALAQLRDAETKAGRGAQFAELEIFLSPDDGMEGSYAVASKRLGMQEDAVRQAVNRLRRKFRETLRRQIADTLQNADEARVDEELAAMRAALRG